MKPPRLAATAVQKPPTTTAPSLRSRSDDQLVELYLSGTDEAFAVIHDRYRPRLRAYARRIVGASGDLEDMLQDVFLIALGALRTEQRPASLAVWLHRLVRARCASRARPLSATRSGALAASQAPARVLDPQTQPPNPQFGSYLRLLTEQQRSALVMREIDGMSYSDISDALGISVPGVRSLLARARLGLTEAVAARDADCAGIRDHLIDAYDRRARAGRHARHHMRACETCAGFQRRLLAVRRSLAAVSPWPALSFPIAKLSGLGGPGSAAAAGGGAALTGGGASFGISQIAAVVCCAAAVTGGAIVRDEVIGSSGDAPDAQTIRPLPDRALRSEPVADDGSRRTAHSGRHNSRKAAAVADRAQAPTEPSSVAAAKYPVGGTQRDPVATDAIAANPPVAPTDAVVTTAQTTTESVGTEGAALGAVVVEAADAVGPTAAQSAASVTGEALNATSAATTAISNAVTDPAAALAPSVPLVDTTLAALGR